MTRAAQVGTVAAGYAAAFVAAVVAGAAYDASVALLPYDTSGGMYAGGELLTALAAFCVVALIPTLAMLWFLRTHHGWWKAIALASLAFAIVGLGAVLRPLLHRAAPTSAAAALLELTTLAQLLGAPLWAVAFASFALLAPTRGTRRMLLAAVTLELVIGVCALVHFGTLRPPF
jgi:hypothetical protein